MRNAKKGSTTMRIVLSTKLLFALCSFTVFPRVESARACSATRPPFPTILGLPGMPGKNGAPGAPGPRGETGEDGRDGLAGPKGEIGQPGPQGPSGRNGTDGEQGLVGPQGPQGPVGAEGSQGPAGPQGLQGPAGPQGPQGLTGPSGSNGSDGVPGVNGADGQTGPPGAQGPPGPPGTLSDVELQQLRQELVVEAIQKICKGDNESNPATSCKAIYECDPNAPSEIYWIRTATEGAIQVFCLMETANCGDVLGGWMRVANIDMTDKSNTCPDTLNFTVQSSTRMCTRSNTIAGCTSVIFPTYTLPYTKVCGRARGYMFHSPDGFFNYKSYIQSTLDAYYVDGLSVTYGSRRSHIWTFAAGNSKDSDTSCCNCPCAYPFPGPPAPPFVGENYFCESGNSGRVEAEWYLDDPLWDSQGCAHGSRCCSRGGPWFSTTLNQEASDDIEVRLCLGEDAALEENIGVEQLEIFVN